METTVSRRVIPAFRQAFQIDATVSSVFDSSPALNVKSSAVKPPAFSASRNFSA